MCGYGKSDLTVHVMLMIIIVAAFFLADPQQTSEEGRSSGLDDTVNARQELLTGNKVNQIWISVSIPEAAAKVGSKIPRRLKKNHGTRDHK